MGSDSKSKKKKEGKSDKSIKSSKSKDKDKDSKSPSKKEKKEKDTKSKKNSKLKNVEGQSELSSILPTAPVSADCVHHKNPFIYFCETCEQLICNQCTVYGPHNNHLHRILKITDAYRSRVFYLSEAIRSNLVDKRDKIIAQLHRLEYRSEQIRFVKNIIARDIRSQYSGILQRLKNSEGVRLANLSHQVSLAQRQIDTINDLGNTFFDLTSFQQNTPTEQERKICKFLNKSKNMYEAIEYLLNKPDRPLPQIKHEELPRQIDDNRTLLQKAVAAKQINEFKNQVMWNLMIDSRQQQKNIKIQVDSKANAMIKELGEEAERLNGRLQSLKMVCTFCGQKLNPSTVNNECEKNISKQEINMVVKTENIPNENYYGNRRHFFSRKVEQS